MNKKMGIQLLLVLMVTTCLAQAVKKDGLPSHLLQWANDLESLKTSALLHQEGPNDRRCFSCLSTTLASCASMQSPETCNPNMTCYTLEAFDVAQNEYIVAKGCFPTFLCQLNQGCSVLNDTRNNTIGSCSFVCCFTDECNRDPGLPPPTPSPPPTTTRPIPTGGSPMTSSEPPPSTAEPPPTTAETTTIATTTVPTTTPAPTTPVGCGGLLTDSSGNLTSPGYGSPGRYTQSFTCTWTITVPHGYIFKLDFLKIKLEKCCDSVVIKLGGRHVRTISGHWISSGRYGRSPKWGNYWYQYWNRHWSKPAIKVDVKGTGEEISITFASNRPVTKSGFFATYKVVHALVCGGQLSGSSGNFSSPGYPGNYPDNASCIWTITVPQGQNLKLNFRTFDTERCCDYVKILVGSREVRRLAGMLYGNRGYGNHRYGNHYYYGRKKRSNGHDISKRTWGSWNRHGHHTGNYYGNYYGRHLTIRGTGELISIVFISDYSITKKGFSASYTVAQGSTYQSYYGDEREKLDI